MKNITMALVVVLVLGLAGSAFAASTTSPSVPVTASVDEVLVLDMVIRAENPDGSLGATVTSMPYVLQRSGNNALRGDKAYHVFLGANTSSRRYDIRSTVGALVSGSNTLPDAWGLFPVSATSDGAGTDISGDTLVSKQSAIGTNKLIYTSNTAGQGAVLELVYGISGGNADGSTPFPGWTPIGPGQAAGTYTASPALTFTLTTL